MKIQFKLAPVFKDHMMFQSNKKIRIFGSCRKGTEIKVDFLNQKTKIKTKSETFLIELDAFNASDKGFSFTVSSKKQSETYYNCLIGDIYLFIGGINLDLPLKNSLHKDDLFNDKVRILDLENDIDDDYPIWRTAGREVLWESSALAHVFAKQMSYSFKTPIGVVVCSKEDASIFSLMSHRDVETHFESHNFIKHHSGDEKLYPSHLYKNILRKIAPMSIKTIIIYQGENDCKHCFLYGGCMSRIVVSYRLLFKDETIPYVIVQLSGYNYKNSTDEEVAHIRDVQTNLAANSSSIFIASAIDIGEEENIVLKDKSVLARRIVNVILDKVHNTMKNSVSPSYYSYNVVEGGINIYTKNNYLNLKSKSGRSIGFEASKDGEEFYRLNTVKVMNNKIVIKDITDVKEIRYAYEKFPVCDIYTTNDLPLLPFKILLVE